RLKRGIGFLLKLLELRQIGAQRKRGGNSGETPRGAEIAEVCIPLGLPHVEKPNAGLGGGGKAPASIEKGDGLPQRGFSQSLKRNGGASPIFFTGFLIDGGKVPAGVLPFGLEGGQSGFHGCGFFLGDARALE